MYGRVDCRMKPKDFAKVTGSLQGAIDTATHPDSRANLTSLHAAIEAIARGDMETCLSTALTDVSLSIFAPPEFPFVRFAKGLDEFRRALEHNFAAVEDQKPTVIDLFSEGNTIVMFGRETGRIKETGATYNVEFVEKFTFAEGRLAQVSIVAAHRAPLGD